MLARIILGATLATLIGTPAHAQFGGLKDKVKQRAESAADRATDKALDKAENKVRCTVGDDECVAEAKKAGKQVESVDEDGNVVAPKPASKPAPKGAAAGASSTTNAAAAGASAGQPGQGAWANYDFVPGERVLFADNFASDRVGNFPRRLELRAGNGEVVDWNGGRWMRFTAENAGEGFAITLPEKLPERFTMEFDLAIPHNGLNIYSGATPAQDFGAVGRIYLSGTSVGLLRGAGDDGSVVDPRSKLPNLYCDGCFNSRPVRVRVHADGRYFKLYLEDQRLGNIPNLEFGRGNKIFFVYEGTQINGEQQPSLITNLSVNAGGRDMYDALMANGRVATQGIYFDTGSDRIRPESSGTLKQIADMLSAHGDLRLTIEGHTDNVGAAAANQTLSEKRAAAVRAALVSQYRVDAGRLEAKGLGASKPTARNETAEGRQQNRRVELVRM